MVKQGCVHGRFQPPHLEHLEYMQEAKRRCEHLQIGITQFDIVDLVGCDVDPHRSIRYSNPFTYSERCEIISQMFDGIGIASSEYSFTPFPIDEPDKLGMYINPDVVCYTTIRDQWNMEKIQRLQKHNYEVIVLWDKSDEEKITASEIRDYAKEGNPKWQEKVTPVVAEYLNSVDFEAKMRSLSILEQRAK